MTMKMSNQKALYVIQSFISLEMASKFLEGCPSNLLNRFEKTFDDES